MAYTGKGYRTGIKKGIYKPKYPEKWIITETFDSSKKEIKYRSSYELHFMEFCDYNDDIVKVNSEGLVIPYNDPNDCDLGKTRKYYMDFVVQNKKGVTYIVEVKPFKETQFPKEPRRVTDKSKKNYENALATYIKNKAKWEAAEKFAKKNGLVFIIITEKELWKYKK